MVQDDQEANQDASGPNDFYQYVSRERTGQGQHQGADGKHGSTPDRWRKGRCQTCLGGKTEGRSGIWWEKKEEEKEWRGKVEST